MAGRPRKGMIEAGSEAPGFRLAPVSGGDLRSLQQILANGPALLAFYKISCPVCQLAAPYLDRISKSASVQVIGISQDDADSTAAFNDRFGVTFPVLLDRANEGYPASNDFGITNVPSLFLVEPDGKISTAFSGFSKRELAALGQRASTPVFQPEDNVPEWKAG